MKTLQKTSPIWSIGIKSGLLTSLGFVAYFTVMKMMGLHLVLELRLFNFVILTMGIVFGIYRLRLELGEGEYYLQGLVQGLWTTAVAVGSFAALFMAYLLFFDHELVEHIRMTFSPSFNFVNMISIFVALAMEGAASGAIISFCAMQYFKTADIKRELKKEFHSIE